MSAKYGILSFLVIFIIFLLFLKNYELWTTPIEEVPKKEVVKRLEKKPEALSMAVDQKNPVPIQSYISISEKNIFSRPIIYLKEITEKVTDNPVMRYHLVMVYYKNKDKENAKKELRKALELDSKFSGADEARQTLKLIQ